MKFKLDKKNAPYIFLLPALILFAVFIIYPFIKTLILSFNVRKGGEYVFAGFENYIKLSRDPVFIKALKNTSEIFIVQVPVMTSLALVIAMGLNASFVKMRTSFRIAFFIPAVTGLVAYSIVFSILLNEDFGIVNYILSLVGVGKIAWFSNPIWAKVAIMTAMTWRWTGYNMVIMLAGLQSIPKTLYEAAEIDGAGPMAKFFNITIPQMRPIILFSVVLSTIGTLKLFSEPYILTNGGPNDSTLTIALYLYRTGFRYFKFGYASAISYVLLFITATLSLLQMKFGGNEENGGI